jgi:hypothetical protein
MFTNSGSGFSIFASDVRIKYILEGIDLKKLDNVDPLIVSKFTFFPLFHQI